MFTDDKRCGNEVKKWKREIKVHDFIVPVNPIEVKQVKDSVKSKNSILGKTTVKKTTKNKQVLKK